MWVDGGEREQQQLKKADTQDLFKGVTMASRVKREERKKARCGRSARVSVWNERREAEQRRQESESGCVWWASWHWLALAQAPHQAAGTQEGKQATPAASSTWAAKRDARNEGKRGRQGRHEKPANKKLSIIFILFYFFPQGFSPPAN